jgi:phage terminase small subunit
MARTSTKKKSPNASDAVPSAEREKPVKALKAYIPDEPDADTPNDELRPEWRAFINHYVTSGYNITESAIAAGYSPKSAHVTGSRLLKNAKIRSAIDAHLATHAMRADEIMARLSAQARGDMSDFINAKGEIDLEQARARGVLHRVKEIRQERVGATLVRTTLKLYDVQGALVKLGHAAGKLADNIRVQGVKTLAEALGADDPNDPLQPFE